MSSDLRGRPTRLLDTQPKQGGGEESIVEVLVRSVRAGATVDDACGTIYPPLHKATWFGWMKRGRAERARLDAAREAGREVAPNMAESIYLDFFDRIQAAERQAKVEALVAIRQAIVGYDDVETTVTEVETPTTITNERGEQEIIMTVKRTTSTKRARRQYWTAALMFLERRYGAEYARRTVESLVGEADGAPSGDDPDELRERAAALLPQLAQLREQRALAASRTEPDNHGGDTAQGPDTENALP